MYVPLLKILLQRNAKITKKKLKRVKTKRTPSRVRKS